MYQIDMPMDYHVWGAMLECSQRYMQKLTNMLSWMTVLLMIWNYLPQECIDIKAIVIVLSLICYSMCNCIFT